MRFAHLATAALLISQTVYSFNISVMTSNYSTNQMFPNLILDSNHSKNCISHCHSFVLDSQNYFKELQACDWTKYIIITSNETGKTILENTRHLFTPRFVSSVLYHEITNTNWDAQGIQDIIIKTFYEHRISNFIWITSKIKEVMESANRVFESDRCGWGALLPCSFNFAFVTFNPEVSKVEQEIQNSPFDNIVLFIINRNAQFLEKAFTLMWRSKRRREFQEITDLNLEVPETETSVCKCFPNIRNGLNGRTLVGLAKEWPPEFFKVFNHVTGKFEFSGFGIDVFNVIADTLNFTYALIPEPGDDTNITWDTYQRIVSTCQVDFGINLFTNNAMFVANITTSFPVRYNNLIGVYIDEDKPNLYKLLLVFKGETYLIIFLCLILAFLQYIFLDRALYSSYKKSCNKFEKGEGHLKLVTGQAYSNFEDKLRSKCYKSDQSEKSKSNKPSTRNRVSPAVCKYHRFDQSETSSSHKFGPRKKGFRDVYNDVAFITSSDPRADSQVYLLCESNKMTYVKTVNIELRCNKCQKHTLRNKSSNCETNRIITANINHQKTAQVLDVCNNTHNVIKRGRIYNTNYNYQKSGIYDLDNVIRRSKCNNYSSKESNRKSGFYNSSHGDKKKSGFYRSRGNEVALVDDFYDNSNDIVFEGCGFYNNSSYTDLNNGGFYNNSGNKVRKKARFCKNNNVSLAGGFYNNNNNLVTPECGFYSNSNKGIAVNDCPYLSIGNNVTDCLIMESQRHETNRLIRDVSVEKVQLKASVAAAFSSPPKVNEHSTSENGHSTSENGHSQMNILLSASWWEYVIDIFFSFFGAILSHATLPETQFWSPRILFGAWSLTTIILAATFTGNLTSEFADQSKISPIKTFEELLGKSDFRWGALKDTVVYSLLNLSITGSTLHKLAEGINHFSKTESVLPDSLDDIITKIRCEKFVAIIGTDMFEYLKDYIHLPGLTFIPDYLLTANQGFIFSENSTLNLLISRQIVAMRDSGIFSSIQNRGRIKVNTTQIENGKGSDLYLNAGNMVGLFIVTGCGAVLALGALLLEVVLSKMKFEIPHFLKQGSKWRHLKTLVQFRTLRKMQKQ